MYFTFTHPVYLFLLLVLPVVFLIHLFTLRNTKKRALKFANFEAISKIQGVTFFSKNITMFFLSLLIIFLLIMSISGLTLHKQIDASSFSFVIAIDTSRSMSADDLKPTRLEAAKDAAKEFVKLAPVTTRIGIISFSGNAYINQNIIDNKRDIEKAINEISQSFVEGTDVYEVILTSTNLLKSEDSKAIILLSDGQVNVGNLDEAIKYANENNVLIDSLAIGTQQGGKTNYGLSTVNNETLRALSFNTEGKFFEAKDTESLLNSFNEMFNLTTKKISIDLSSYLTFGSILLFILEYFLINSRYHLFP
jgi:Ca-activated chloride channel homolog